MELTMLGTGNLKHLTRPQYDDLHPTSMLDRAADVWIKPVQCRYMTAMPMSLCSRPECEEAKYCFLELMMSVNRR